MKLHLPKLLRNSVLACITAVAGIATTTVGTATFTGGVVAFTLASQQVAAETATVSSAQLIGAVKTDSVTKIEVNSGGVLTFSNAGDEGVVGVELTDGLVINDGGSVVAKGKLNTSGFVTNTTPVTINAGGTLRLTEVDVLGYSGGGYAGAPVQSITIAGESGKTANLVIDKRQTLTTSLTLGGYTSVTIGEGGITDAANGNRGGIDIFHRADGTSGATITVSGTNNSFDAYIIKTRALQLSLANAAEIKFSRSVVGSGAIDLNATGNSSIVTYEGDVTADTLHTNRSDITFGNGTDACTATFGRVEIGNSNASGSHTVTLSSNAKLVITGNNNGTDYKQASLLIGEWNTATTMDVAGTLVAANAKLLTGDSGGILNLQSGSVVAVNGIGVASVKSDKSQKLDLNMAAGSTLVVGPSGIDMRGKAFNTAISGGTIGTLADSVSINPVLTVTGDLTIDTTLYSINNAAVSRGTAESSLYLKGGVAGEGTVSVVGSGTLYLQGATVGADIVVNEGALGILGGLTLENGATITIGENAVLKDSLSVAQTENWGPTGETRLAYKVSVPSSSLPSGVINNGKLEVDNVVAGHGSISDTTVTFLDKSLKLDEIVLNGGKYAIWEQDTASETSAFLKQADKVTLNNAGFLALSSYFNGGTAFTNTGLDFDIEVGRDGAYFVAYGNATADFKGAVSGSGAITKTDVGTVTLSGDMSGYTGSVSVRGGELVIGKLATLSSIDIASGATLTAGEGINFTSDLSFSGGQTLDFGEGSTLSNNLVNVVGDGVTLKGKVTGANTALRQGVDGTITISGSNTAVTVNRFVGGDNDGAETILKITDGATFTANRSDWNNNQNTAGFMLGHWGNNNAHSVVDIENGSVNVLSSGVSVKDGFGIINVEEKGIFNIKALAGSQKDKITVNLNGGMINIGELGIAQNSAASTNTNYDIELNLNGGTLGILDTATSWQTWKELELKGDTTINTDLYAAKTDGTHGAYTGKAGTITLNAGVTGDYMLTKSGVGTLVLGSVANLKISSGYVKALTGGLTIGTSLATMTAEGGSFLYSGLANSTADKITAANYAGPLFLTLEAPEAGTYALFQGSNSLTAAQVNVELLANRGLSATVQEVVDGLVHVQVSGQADTNTYDLQWNVGHQDNVWSNSSTENWYTSGTTTANRFSMGDNVEFAGTAGETITVPFDVTAGTIKVSTTGYTLKGDGKVTTTSLTVEDGVEFTLATAPGNVLGDVTLGAGSTLNLGVNSSGALSKAIGDGAFTLEGSATVNITAGNITWGRAPQGENAALALVVQNGASMTLNTSSEKITSLTVEKGGTMVINNAGQNPRSAGTITVRGQLNSTGDAFGWGNPATGGLTKLLIDGGTWTMGGGNNTFSNLPIVLDKGTINMGVTTGGGDGFDFFSDNATGNYIQTLASAAGQSVIQVKEGAVDAMSDNSNKLNIRKNLLTFDVARASALAATDTSDLLIAVGVRDKNDVSGDARRALVKKGNGILELSKGFVNDVAVDLYEGTLRLSGAAQLKNGALAMTAGSTLDLNLSSSASSAGAITGSGTIVKRNSGSVSLTGLSADWTGKIALQKGTLGMGDALALGTGRTLEVAGGKLDSALTLSGGSLVLNGALDLNSHDLNLSADNKASLSFGTGFVPSEFDSITLISGISSLTGITVDDTTSLGDLFNISDMTLADYKVVYSDNTLTLTSESLAAPALEWNPTNDSTWKNTGSVGEDTFYNADVPNVSFGAVDGTETVTVEGEVTANEVTINPGADGKYEFIASTGAGPNQITAGKFHLASGTLVLGSGVIGSEVALAMGGDTTLKWGEGNTQDYSGKLTIRGNATLDAGSNSVTLANEVGGMTADSTTTLKGNFTLNNDTVLKGAVVIDGGILTLQGHDDTDADNYNQNFRGSGSLSTTSNHDIHLKGTNTYAGVTDLGGGSVLYIDTHSAYSAASKMTGSGNLNLKATGEYAWNMASDLTGTVTIASGATVKVTDALTTKFDGAGGLTVAGGTAGTPITWDNTGKTYTGVTEIAAGAYVTTAGPLSTGNGDIKLAATSQLTITNMENWQHSLTASSAGVVKISGENSFADGTSFNKLYANATATELRLTGDGTVLTLSKDFKHADAITVESGSRLYVLSSHVGESGDKLTLKLAGSGAASATAGSKEAAAVTFDDYSRTLHTNVELTDDATIYVGPSSGIIGTISGTLTTGEHELTVAGPGTLAIQGAVSDADIAAAGNLTMSGAVSDADIAAAGNLTMSGAVSDADIAVAGNLTMSGAVSGTLITQTNGVAKLTGNVTGTTINVEGGEFRVNADQLLSSEAGVNTLSIKAGRLRVLSGNAANLSSSANVNLYTGATFDLWFSANKTYTISDSFAIIDADPTDGDNVAYIDSPRANTLVLDTAVKGSSVVELINVSNDNKTTADDKATLSLVKDNSETFTGTWKSNGNWKIAANHVDALTNATVLLTTQSSELFVGVDTANLAKLTGTTGTVTGSGKTLNIANSETTGVEYSGAIGDGVTIQVSEGYQKITGADKTGSYTLSTVRTPVADDDGLGGGALLLSSGATPVAPVLDLTGYAHSADDGAGVTTILAGDQGSIKGLVLGKNMLLTAKTEDVTVSSLLSAAIKSDMTLAGGKVKVHLGEITSTDSVGDAVYNAGAMTQYDMGNNVLTLKGQTELVFTPDSESGKLALVSNVLFTDIKDIVCVTTSEGGVDTEKSIISDLTEVKIPGTDTVDHYESEALNQMFTSNLSADGRTKYKVVVGKFDVLSEHYYSLDLLVEGGAADLVWNGGTGTWDTDKGNKNWLNESEADAFWSDDHVTFDETETGTTPIERTITVGKASDVGGETVYESMRVASMTITGDADYTFKGGEITSGEGLGNVYIGTTGEDGKDYTGTVTFENANSWKGNTNINSGAVVAKNAAALSDTTVNLKGGSLTVDGVALDGEALDATVKMLGGALVGNGAASATVDLSDKDAAKSVNALAGSTLTLTVKGAEDAPGDVAGKVVINDLKDDQGTSLATGTVKLTETAVRAGGSMTVADGSVEIAGLTVDGKKTETVDDQELVTAAGTVEVQKGNLTVTGDMLNAGTLNIAGKLAENGVTKLATVIVTGELDNTSGTITIGSAAVEDDAETPEDEYVAATYGSLAVSDGMYVGSSGTLVISEKSALSVQSNLSAAQATIINDGSLTLHNGSIGSLKGSTAAANELFITEAKAEGDKVSIGSNVSLKKLQNNGLLEVDGSLTMTAATTNGGDVKATALILEEAGNTFGDVVTSQVNIGKIDSAKTVLTADSLTGATDAGVTLVFDVMMPTVDENGEQVLANLEGAAHPGKSYNVLAVAGGLAAVKHAVNTNAEWQQYLYDHDKQKLAANFDESGNMTLTVTNVSGDTWKTSKTYTENGLIVEKTGDTNPIKDMYSILDRVSGVEVDADKTIDLTALTADDDGLVLRNLRGTKSLTVKGDTADKVSAGGAFAGELKLDGLSATLDLTGTRVIGTSGDTALSGTLKDGMLVVKQSSTAQGNNLDLTGSSSISILLDKDEVTNEQIAEIMTNGVADLGDVDLEKETNITIGTYSDASGFVTSVAYDKYFANARLEDGVVVVDRNESYYSGKLAGSTMSANGAAGMQLADGALVVLNPQGAARKGDLADVLDRLDALVATGNTAAADELGASLAGASTAVLGMAVSGDVDRQLQAIRNRTTTMGVDQSVANEDMPYFNAWINAEGDRSELSESGTEGGYELSSWGGTVGFDVDLCPTFTAGMALTAMYGDIDTTGADKASGNIDTYYVTAFARYAPSAWTHTFVATVGMSDISLDRHVAGAEMEGETDGLSFGLMYEVGRVFALTEDGSTCLQPVFNVTWKHTAIDAYTEDGSDLALEVDEQTLDTVTFGLGARLQTVVGESMYNRTSILEARVLAKADVGDRSGSADVALSAVPGAKASVDSAEMGAFGLEAGAGLTIPVGDEGGSIFMDASVELRSDYTNVNGTVGYRINF